MNACSCGARQVGVNPIRLAGFKRCRPGPPKPVTSSHPATAIAPRSSIPISLPPVIPCFSSYHLHLWEKPFSLSDNQAPVGLPVEI